MILIYLLCLLGQNVLSPTSRDAHHGLRVVHSFCALSRHLQELGVMQNSKLMQDLLSTTNNRLSYLGPLAECLADSSHSRQTLLRCGPTQ